MRPVLACQEISELCSCQRHDIAVLKCGSEAHLLRVESTAWDVSHFSSRREWRFRHLYGFSGTLTSGVLIDLLFDYEYNCCRLRS